MVYRYLSFAKRIKESQGGSNKEMKVLAIFL